MRSHPLSHAWRIMADRRATTCVRVSSRAMGPNWPAATLTNRTSKPPSIAASAEQVIRPDDLMSSAHRYMPCIEAIRRQDGKMFQAQDPNFRERVRASFPRQQVMATLGIEIAHLEPGEVHLTMPPNRAYTQQHGFMHAGIITTALDSACGYAAFSLMPADAAVLTVEFKTNLLAPAKGERFIFRAHVVKPGRTLTGG